MERNRPCATAAIVALLRPQCDDRFSMPLIDLRMPAPFDRYHYSEDFAEDREALRDWCEQVRPR